MAVTVPYRSWYNAGLKEWLFTTDHKKIALYYGITILLFFAVAGLMGLGIRLELWRPGEQFISPDTYNYFLTAHGVVALLWWAIGVWSAFANFLIPLMVGARDVAFPRLNALSWWTFFAASVLVLLTFYPGNQIRMMWTGYPPFSINENAGQAIIYILVVHLTGAASIMGAINFLVTTLRMRAPGITLKNMNLMLHSIAAANTIQLLGVPSFAGAVTMLFLDKYIGTNFFNPGLGGDPVLYQNVFWFYSHPAVYVMVLPAFGVFSEVISTFSRKPIFGQTAMALAIWAIAILGFMVWIHHMFTSGVPDWIRILMSYTTVLIGVPTGVKIFNWVATLHRGSIRYTTPMLFTLGGIFMFLIGGLTGIPLALPAFDINVHDSHFVVAHFHYVLGMAVTFGAISGIYYWYPKVTGKMYNEALGKLSFWISMVGSNLFYFFQFIVGLEGMPRRYADYPPIAEWITLHQIQTVGAFILAVGLFITLINWIISAFVGQKAPANPWESNSLEWSIPSPPPPHNFDRTPELPPEWSPYDYHKKYH